MAALGGFFIWLGGGNPWVATFLISLLPVIELRGAIPFGTDAGLWGARALNHWQALGVALLGNVVVAAVILALLVPVFTLLRKVKFFNRFVQFCEQKFQNKAEARENRSSFKKLVFVFAFCAIPLPLTGVWSAAGVATFMRLGYWKSLAAVAAGALASGLVMVGITLLFGQAALALFYFFCFAAVVILAAFFAVALFKKPTEKTK